MCTLFILILTSKYIVVLYIIFKNKFTRVAFITCEWVNRTETAWVEAPSVPENMLGISAWTYIHILRLRIKPLCAKNKEKKIKTLKSKQANPYIIGLLSSLVDFLTNEAGQLAIPFCYWLADTTRPWPSGINLGAQWTLTPSTSTVGFQFQFAIWNQRLFIARNSIFAMTSISSSLMPLLVKV